MRKIIEFSDDWQYYGIDVKGITLQRFGGSGETVALPHYSIAKSDVCCYRKVFQLALEDIEAKKVFIDFDGIDTRAKIYINGILTKIHGGGYLPFSIDVTGTVKTSVKNVIVIKTDSNHKDKKKNSSDSVEHRSIRNTVRGVNIRIVDKIYIPNRIGCGRLEGGIFAFTERIQDNVAFLKVSIAVRNTFFKMRRIVVKNSLFDADGVLVTELYTKSDTINENYLKRYDNQIQVIDPELWTVDRPYLYSLKTEIYSNDELVDTVTTQIGLRIIEVSGGDIYINGEKVDVSKIKEYENHICGDVIAEEDVLQIKNDGYNVIQPSNNIISESFMEICDRLGMLVIIPTVANRHFRGALLKRNRKKLYKTIKCNCNHPSAFMYECHIGGIKANKVYRLAANICGEQATLNVKVGTLRDVLDNNKNTNSEFSIPFVEYDEIKKARSDK